MMTMVGFLDKVKDFIHDIGEKIEETVGFGKPTADVTAIHVLQNPGFESPPTNLPTNSTNAFAPLNSTINSIPGWSYQGTVKYVTSTSPDDDDEKRGGGGGQHAIYLGQNGKINQTFEAEEESNHYLLTFNLQPPQSNCSNPTSVIISAPDRAVRVSYQPKFGSYGSWEAHACYLGSHGNRDLINLIIENQSMDGGDDLGGNTTNCGVILDSFILKSIANPIRISGIEKGSLPQAHAYVIVTVCCNNVHSLTIDSSNFGFILETTGLYFQAALKFLHGASLYEAASNDGAKHAEMAQSLEVYGSTAKLCAFVAYEYERCKEMVVAALAYKCMELAHMRVIYFKHSSAKKDRNDLLTALQMAPPVW